MARALQLGGGGGGGGVHNVLGAQTERFRGVNQLGIVRQNDEREKR